MSYGLIYKATNLQNRKVYIGQTVETLNSRKSKHKNKLKEGINRHFFNSLRLYGWHNFKWEVLGYCDSKEEMDTVEKECIWFYQSVNPIYGYNISRGGHSHNIIDIDKAVELFESGWNMTQIIKELKCDRSNLRDRLKLALGEEKYNYYLNNIMKKHFIRLNGATSPTYKPQITLDKIFKYLKQGYTLTATANELNVTRMIIKARLEKEISKEFYKEIANYFLPKNIPYRDERILNQILSKVNI